MSDSPAYNQLLTLIASRSQQWLRNQIEALPMLADPDDPAIGDLAEIIAAANICGTLRGAATPLQAFVKTRFTPQFIKNFMAAFRSGSLNGECRGASLVQFLPPDDRMQAAWLSGQGLADRLSLSDLSDPDLLAEVEAMLRQPVPAERLSDGIIDGYARVLSLSYRYGAERPRFPDVRTYGNAFANCLRFADWAQRKGRLVPLAQMSFCLRLIDPDHDVMPMLSDVIASQRPDGSFPHRLGYGVADQDRTALQPTLAVLAALHMVIYRRRRNPGPLVPMAA